jgi:hypothetical protein
MRRAPSVAESEVEVLLTTVVILMMLWLVAVVSAYRVGGFVCPMLVVERVVLFIDSVTGHRLRIEEHMFEDERLH